jgi:acyl-CoA reductase-like NAD-dependent aldehyde dehydrogenase
VGGESGEWPCAIRPITPRRGRQVREATLAEVDRPCAGASDAAPQWAAVPPAERARMLERAADRSKPACSA